jgi:hypothetical protein
VLCGWLTSCLSAVCSCVQRMEDLELSPQRQVYMDVLAACEHAGFW